MHLLLAFILLWVVPAVAVDRGQYKDVPKEIKDWFKSVLGPNGVPCCDIADGHRTSYDMRGGIYLVPIDGVWIEVPPNTVIRNVGNPIGDAVVWYFRRDGAITIRCFVPASEV